MASAYDGRLVRLDITIDDQKLSYDQDYYIVASGSKFTNGLFGQCNIRIDDIAKKTRDYLTTRTSTWRKNRSVANLSLNIGRESYGTFEIFNGQALASNPTQPPDIGLILNSLQQGIGLSISGSVTVPDNASVKSIAQAIANSQSPPLTLNYEASTNPAIGNYHFTGAVGQQVQKLSDLGIVQAYVDGTTLVVTDLATPRKLPVVEINANTGLVGVPEITQLGARCVMLIRNEIAVGSPVQLTSAKNPAVNGSYSINKLMYNICSREEPFYWIMDLIPQDLDLASSS